MNSKNILLGILIILVFAVGFAIGRFTPGESTSVQDTKSSSVTTTTNTPSGTTTTTTEAETLTASMSDDQKKVLSALGIDVEKITPAMITCAETSLGASRVEEIKGGSAVTFTEKVKLLACYK